MSYLLHGIASETSFALEIEMPLPQRTGDDSALSPSKTRDEDWDQLWTDLGGEA